MIYSYLFINTLKMMVLFTVMYLTCLKLAENGFWLHQTEQSVEEWSIV